MKRIIVNADDFGISPGVNEAVVAAFDAGCLSSATILVNAAAAEEAVRLAVERPALGVGLHFTLTSGRALALSPDHPLIDRDGRFGNRARLAKLVLTRRIDEDQIEAELEAQFARLRTWGIQATHIDSHQHVHAIPVVFKIVARFCQRHELALRIPWRSRAVDAQKTTKRRLRERALQALISYGYWRWARSLRVNRGFGSVFDLGEIPPVLQPGDYERIVAGVRAEPFELMVHPSGPAAEMHGLTRIGRVSEAEGAFLRTGRLTEVVRAYGYQLSTYREVT